MTQLKAVSACTNQSNNALTDAQEYVQHVVTLSDGTTLLLMATDPLDAIKKANKRLELVKI